MSPMSLLTARCLNGNSGTLGLQPTPIVGQRHGNCDVRSALAATSSVAPLPAEATTSLLLIAFIGYLFCYDFSANRHFVDEEHWLTAIAPFILTVQS
jgi:hypothetical protein